VRVTLPPLLSHKVPASLWDLDRGWEKGRRRFGKTFSFRERGLANRMVVQRNEDKKGYSMGGDKAEYGRRRD